MDHNRPPPQRNPHFPPTTCARGRGAGDTGRRRRPVGSLGDALVQPFTDLVGGVRAAATLRSGDDHAGRGDAGETGQPEPLPPLHAGQATQDSIGARQVAEGSGDSSDSGD
jgi:hypothetical protein